MSSYPKDYIGRLTRYLLPAGLIFIFITGNVTVAGEEERPYSGFLDAQTQEAVDRGLEFIVSYQDLREGPFRGSFGDYRGDYKYRIAVTSFACLSLVAGGNLPGRGRYGDNVKAGVEFILRCARKDGYITCQGDHSRMHGHGFATLLLAQVYGTSPDTAFVKKIRDHMERAVHCIIQAQTEDGGWGYYPTDKFHEGSITVCQLQALRACKDTGVYVPKDVIDKAIRYLKLSANPNGSFKYRLNMPADRESFPLTAAGVSSLNATGEYEMEEIRKGLEFMMGYIPPHGKQDQLYLSYYYYGHFYAAQAMFHAPSSYWEKWYPAIRSDLIAKQARTGVWGTHSSPGRSYFGIVYATSIATLILQIPYNYLPIFQK